MFNLKKMAFKPTNPSRAEGQEVLLQMAASATVAKYDALAFSSGNVQRAVSGTTEVRYIALEDKTTGAGENPQILCLPVEGIRFEADTNADPVFATDVWVKADLTDHDTLNESASTNDVFFIEKIVGDTTDKKVQGYFVNKDS